MSPNVLSAVATELGELVVPVRRVVEDARPPRQLVGLLQAAGWALPEADDDRLAMLTAGWGEALAVVDALPGAVRTGDLSDVVGSLAAIAEAVQALDGLTDGLSALFTAAAEDPAAIGAPLAEDLAHVLTLDWLARRRPVALGVLQALRVVGSEDVPQVTGHGGVALRRGGRRPRVRPDALPDLLRDPVGTLQAAYLAGSLSATHDAQTLDLVLATRLRALVAAVGGELDTLWPWQDVRGLSPADAAAAGRTLSLLLPLAAPDGGPLLPFLTATAQFLSAADRGELGRPGPGVELSLDGLASVAGVRGGWTVALDVAASAGTVLVTPDAVTAQGGSGVVADLVMSRDGDVPVLGADGGTRLELGHPSVRAGVELSGRPDASLELRLSDAALVVDAGDGDSFVADALAAFALRADFDLGLAWSRSGGLRLSGGTGFTVHVPIGRDLGGAVVLESVDATLAVSGEELALALGATAELVLGPFTARVDGVGLRAALALRDERDGNLGWADLTLGFLPPTGFGLELDLEGASGGGYVWIEAEIGRYTGALSLQFVAIGLSAIVVVDTRLPDDPDGWALFASLGLTFPSVPLGFGFFLSGVGGIVCLNRTLDVEALAGGLSSGAVDAVLFPEDALAAAPLIVSQLDAWFPLAPGSSVFGVAGRITWGTPATIVTADVGFALSIPELDFVVLGSVTVALPEAEPLLELHMDVLGAVDLSAGTVMVVASLHDSSLLHTIHLSGGMAMYASFGANPYFLLSIGGYHPDFQPPSELPAAVCELDRMRAEIAISEDIGVALEAYVAVTSNTLQFGAVASLEASDRFLGVTYTARGSAGFDVLLVLAPFSFSAAFHAGVSITAGAGDKELLAVGLSASLTGPKPWIVSGTAEFDFFGLNVTFQVSFGGATGAAAPATVDVLGAVRAALADPSAWRAAVPAGADAGAVVVASDAPEGELWVRPDGELEVAQTIAPLDRPLDHYGIYAVAGPASFGVTGAGIGDAEQDPDPVLDWFSPAQFDDLSRAEN